MSKKIYYNIGEYQIIFYDKDDEVLFKRKALTLYTAKQRIEEEEESFVSAKVLMVVHDTKYNNHTPKPKDCL